MGNIDAQIRTAEVLARLTVAAEGLGIDLHALQPRLASLGSAPGHLVRIWVDSAAERFAIQCRQRDGAAPPFSLERPGSQLIELETIPGGGIAEVVQVVGSRPLLEDLAVLAAAGVAAPAREQLARRLTLLGHGTCGLLARREEAGITRWRAGLVVPGDISQVLQVATPLVAIATELAIPPLQCRLLEQSILALAAPHGFTIAFGCDQVHAFDELTVELRDVPWRQAIGLTDALRPGMPVAPRMGIFAGALSGAGGDHASAIEVTFRAGTLAGVRVAIELAA